jgi:hypothetical protein
MTHRWFAAGLAALAAGAILPGAALSQQVSLLAPHPAPLVGWLVMTLIG